MKSTLNYNDPYAFITGACEALLGRIQLSQSPDPLLFVWRMARHATEMTAIESTVCSAAQLMAVFEDMETKNMYRGHIADAIEPLSDWHLVFLIQRFICLVALSDDLLSSPHAHERNSWRLELLNTFRDALSARSIDLCTFVHMLQLPVQPSLQRIDDSILNAILHVLYPEVSSPMADIHAMQFEPLCSRISPQTYDTLLVCMELEQSFGIAWSAAMAGHGGGSEDVDGLLDS